MKYQIQNILENNNHQYIMGIGGDGIEFFSYLFSRSPNFDSIEVIKTEQNRFLTKIPEFYNFLASLVQEKQSNPDTIVDALTNIMNARKDGQQLIYEAMSIQDKKYLFKMHFSLNSYFNNRASFMVLDNEYWWLYRWALWIGKVWVNKIPHDRFEHIFEHRIEYFKHSNPDKIRIMMEFKKKFYELNPDFIFEGLFVYLYFLDTIPSDYFSYDINELMLRGWEIIKARSNITYMDYLKNVDRLTIPKINYSDIIKNRAYQKYFSVSDPLIQTKIDNWHFSNLELMEKNNFKL